MTAALPQKIRQIWLAMRQVWQAILRESDRFGFEPEERHWVAAQRAAAMHEPPVPHFWWSELVPSLVPCFTAGEAHTLALTLDRIASLRRDLQLDRTRSPFNEQIELSDLSAVIDLARLGAFEWNADGKGGTILSSEITSGTLQSLRNLARGTPPGESPEACDLSERAEIRRLGAYPHSTALLEANTVEMTWWGWRAILSIFAMHGMEPTDPEWLQWVHYYAYYDPERAHRWWDTGYLRISTLSEHDTSRLKAALLRYLDEPDAILRRQLSYPERFQVADEILALSTVLIEEVRAVADLCAHGAINWTIYSDGIIHLSGQ